jgi:Na+/phosphate symporter
MSWTQTADKLEKEFLRREQENKEKHKRVQKLLQENDEIRKIKQKISESYLRKNHTAQIFEKEIRKTQEMVEVISKKR